MIVICSLSEVIRKIHFIPKVKNPPPIEMQSKRPLARETEKKAQNCMWSRRWFLLENWNLCSSRFVWSVLIPIGVAEDSLQQALVVCGGGRYKSRSQQQTSVFSRRCGLSIHVYHRTCFGSTADLSRLALPGASRPLAPSEVNPRRKWVIFGY